MTLAAGEQRIAGVAYASDRGVSRVDFSIDDGGTWQPARLLEPMPDTDAMVRWEATFMMPSSGSVTITMRATDGTGDPQTDEFQLPSPTGARAATPSPSAQPLNFNIAKLRSLHFVVERPSSDRVHVRSSRNYNPRAFGQTESRPLNRRVEWPIAGRRSRPSVSRGAGHVLPPFAPLCGRKPAGMAGSSSRQMSRRGTACLTRCLPPCATLAVSPLPALTSAMVHALKLGMIPKYVLRETRME